MLIKKEKYTLIDIVKLPIKINPFYGILIIVVKVLDGIAPSLQIFAVSQFIDKATLLVNSNETIRIIIPSILAITTLIAYMWTSEKLVKFAEVKLEINIRNKLRSEMIEKRAKLHYKHIENSDSWDLISRVCTDPEIKIKKGYIIFLNFMSLLIKVLGILAILLLKVWWITLVILMGATILFIISFKSGKIIYKSTKDLSKQKRRYEYINEILTDREYVDERSLFGFSKNINERWLGLYEEVRKIALKTELKEIIKIQVGTLITSLISISILIVLLQPLISGDLTIGMFISISSSMISLIKTMSSDLPWYTREIAKAREYLSDLKIFAFLDEDEFDINVPLSKPVTFKTLEFRNVKFKYPGTETYVLKGVSFLIENGKHYAFVGINGAGKTTIIKILTSLYREYEGVILIDGIDIKTYNKNYCKSLCSVVYQDFAKYFISIKDNINISQINKFEKHHNDELIQKVISDMDLNDLIHCAPNGIDSYLGKIKDTGVDISEGQWQKIAMARSIINQSNLRILDEPTSSLDPISESNMYDKFEKISEGKTTIFISHRLGSTKLADKIFILDNGKIIEEGSHQELINMNGMYAHMYDSQKGWYS